MSEAAITRVVTRPALRLRETAPEIEAHAPCENPLLVVLAGPGAGQSLRLPPQGERTVGSGPDADLVLEGSDLAPVHLRIRCRAGAIQVEPEGAVLLDGRPVREQVRWDVASTLRLGATTLGLLPRGAMAAIARPGGAGKPSAAWRRIRLWGLAGVLCGLVAGGAARQVLGPAREGTGAWIVETPMPGGGAVAGGGPPAEASMVVPVGDERAASGSSLRADGDSIGRGMEGEEDGLQARAAVAAGSSVAALREPVAGAIGEPGQGPSAADRPTAFPDAEPAVPPVLAATEGAAGAERAAAVVVAGAGTGRAAPPAEPGSGVEPARAGPAVAVARPRERRGGKMASAGGAAPLAQRTSPRGAGEASGARLAAAEEEGPQAGGTDPQERLRRVEAAWREGAIEEAIAIGEAAGGEARTMARRIAHFARALEAARAAAGPAAAPALEEALGWAEEIGGSPPQVLEVRRRLAALHLAAAERAEAAEDLEGALRHCEQALAIAPRDPDARRHRERLGALARPLYLEGYSLQDLDRVEALRRFELAARIGLPGDPWREKAATRAARLREERFGL